jgi:hypothetical protein
VLFLAEVLAHRSIDRKFHETRGNRFPLAPALIIVRNNVTIPHDVRAEFRDCFGELVELW